MKPGVFTQMYIQLVFAVKNRETLLKKNHQKEIFSYMSGIVSGLKHKSIIVNGLIMYIFFLVYILPFQFLTLYMNLNEVHPCSSIIMTGSEENFSGRMAMEDFRIAGLR